ncbi:hypothetical protein [Paenibacillus sp. FSL R5-0923]|uniref:hypothetical protein n=1 Tax=Paenibacillus sp. FSL R5-0923 TaxID=2921666 RepID=UPI00117EBD13
MINDEIYLLVFDPEQVAKLTEDCKKQAETLYSIYEGSYEQASSSINSVTQSGKGIEPLVNRSKCT